MPFELLRRQFLDRFLSSRGSEAQAPQQAPAAQTPATATADPQARTFAEQEAALRPQGPAATLPPEWQAFLAPTTSTASQSAAQQQDRTPTRADLETTQQQRPTPTPVPAQTTAQQPPPALVAAVQKKGLLSDFEAMWKAHPHNNGSADSVSAGTVNENQGWDPDQYANTCAIRVSVMLNTLGGEHKITRDKAVAAGIPKGRVFYSAKTKWYYLLAASEIAQYVAHHQGKPSVTWPATGRFKDEATFESDFSTKIEPALAGKKGFVFFDKIFGYSGSGHVDIFDGSTLSAATHWYASQALKVWYV